MEAWKEKASVKLREDDGAVERSAFLARYAYRIEMAAKTIGAHGANGFVLEQLPALAMLSRTRRRRVVILPS